jgi:hypothetical protein
MPRELDLFARPELIPRTARYREIEKLDRVYHGTQYEGRPDWWTGKNGPRDDEAPLRERRPCVIYKLPKAATQQVVRFLFGEKRFPKVSFEVNDGDELDPNFPPLTEEEASLLTEWTQALVQNADVQPNTRAIATKAIACRTAVVILELDAGKFKTTLPRPQDCHAQFEGGDVGKPVTRLVWSYEYDREMLDDSGQRTTFKRFVFRREWDAANVYLYDDAELIPGKEVEWMAPRVSPHGLSFCPVLWIRNESEYSSGLDGNSLYDGLTEEFEALDFALSRRHQGVAYLGAPQLIETGVEPGDGPDASGRKAGPQGYSGDAEHAVAPPARRIAPDAVWTYEGKEVNVSLLETSGKAFEVGTNHVNDIRSRVLETMGVVLTSMADTVSRVTVGADMSARFLALAHAPLIALVQEYRHTWWPKALRPLLSMMMRMTYEANRKGELIMVPGTDKVADILNRFVNRDGQWTTPQMAAHWGRFFEPSSQEISTNVDAANKAHEGKLISHETAVEFTSHDFSVDSVETELEEIEAESEQALARETTELQRLQIDTQQLPAPAQAVQADRDHGRPTDGQVDAQPAGQ